VTKGKALSIPVPGPGRKSLYREEFADQAFKLCLLGATDQELADFFEVVTATIYTWKHEHPAFLEATIAGKVKADAEVAHSLYRSATGHEVTAEKVVKNGDSFEAVRYKQFVPADPNAAYKWLCNRRRTDWRDRHEVQHDVSGDLAALLREARLRHGEKQTVFIGEPE
jgi:hypothetical protein